MKTKQQQTENGKVDLWLGGGDLEHLLHGQK